MPLPLFLAIGAGVAAAAGVGTAVSGAVKMKKASDTLKSAQERQKASMANLERRNKTTCTTMDVLGKYELSILESFADFSNTFEKIKNRPTFEKYSKDGVELPQYDGEQLKEVSVGAGVLLGGLGGAALGTAGGFAAAGATTAAVMALGTASTGTAIASLSGVAATNATLAALGGGAIAAGGGGIALGTTILGAASLGVGVLIGGIIFCITGNTLSSKADEAWAQMIKNEQKINNLCAYLVRLEKAASDYYVVMTEVRGIYKRRLSGLDAIVNLLGKTDWNEFTDEEKELTENTVLLTGLLYNMCKVKLVEKSETNDEPNKINSAEIEKSIADAKKILKEKNLFGDKP